jgi:hypothetical protein
LALSAEEEALAEPPHPLQKVMAERQPANKNSEVSRVRAGRLEVFGVYMVESLYIRVKQRNVKGVLAEAGEL